MRQEQMRTIDDEERHINTLSINGAKVALTSSSMLVTRKSKLLRAGWGR